MYSAAGKACFKGIFSKSVTDNICNKVQREPFGFSRFLTMATSTWTDTATRWIVDFLPASHDEQHLVLLVVVVRCSRTGFAGCTAGVVCAMPVIGRLAVLLKHLSSVVNLLPDVGAGNCSGVPLIYSSQPNPALPTLTR